MPPPLQRTIVQHDSSHGTRRAGPAQAPARLSQTLLEATHADTEAVLAGQGTSLGGLSAEEAAERLEAHGPNEAVREKRLTPLERLWGNARNPLVILLMVLAAISFATGDLKATTLITVMVVLGVTLRYFQEARA